MYGDAADEYTNSGFRVVRDYADLPPVEDGHTRMYHGTMSSNAKSIAEQGLVPQPEFGNPYTLLTAEPQLKFADGKRQRFFGNGIFVVDVPNDMIGRQQYDNIYELGMIPREQIVGVYVPGFDAGDTAHTVASAMGIDQLSFYKETIPQIMDDFRAGRNTLDQTTYNDPANVIVKAQVEFLNNKAFIKGFTAADASSAAHELVHVVRREMEKIARGGNIDVANDLATWKNTLA